MRLHIVNENDSLPFDECRSELLELLQEEEQGEHFVYPYAITIENNLAVSDQPLFRFIQGYEWSEHVVDEAVDPLFKHPLGRKFLSLLSAEEKAELLQEAEQLLALQVGRGGAD